MQTVEILTNINAFKQYYVCKQELVSIAQLLSLGCDVQAKQCSIDMSLCPIARLGVSCRQASG